MTKWCVHSPMLHGEWDKNLASLEGSNFFQSHAWGKVKEATGWRVLPMIALTENAVIAMALVLHRPQPLSGLMVWLPGGIAGDLSLSAASLISKLKKELGAAWLYLRANFVGFTDSPELTVQQRKLGWSKPSIGIGSGLSMSYNTNLEEQQRIAAASVNWRHNLKRSRKYGLSFEKWDDPDIEHIVSIYRSMEMHKGLSPQVSKVELNAMLKYLQKGLVLYRCVNTNGETIALRAYARWGDQAFDLLAAASPLARKVYASHGLLWRLFNDCFEKGIRRYDLGGVEPSKNKGVFDFKKGTGADLFAYLGEWEVSSPSWAKSVANCVLRLKQKVKVM
jgi:lipid II:glycine glycyltransferase (peptidoglycan interpeptide bridge formation enzyme)